MEEMAEVNNDGKAELTGRKSGELAADGSSNNKQQTNAQEPETEFDIKSKLFGIHAGALDKLFDPKDPEELAALGGPDGITKKLKLDPLVGLVSNLTEPSLRDRALVFGENRLPSVKGKNIFQLMWLAMHDKMLILLSVAALVSLAIGIYQDASSKSNGNCYGGESKIHWVEGLAILIAVLIVVLAGSINDYQKERQFRRLNAKKDDKKVKVFRDSEQSLLSVYDVVVGDVLCLEPGDVIVADGLYLSGSNLKCDESAATGETDALKKSKDKDPFILSGSKVLEGVGRYVITNVGIHSFHGKTMMALRTENESTPLQLKLNVIAETIAKLGAGVAALMLFTLIIKYVIITLKNEGFGPNCQLQECGSEAAQQIINIFITSITIVVVAVPEGLPLAVTLALAFAMTRMQKDNNLVRQLQACETMGGATCICSDKTGTLTQNEMTVVRATIGRHVTAESESKIPTIPEQCRSAVKDAQAQFEPLDLYKILVENCAINSSAFESTDEHTGAKVLIGSKTECALLKFVGACGEAFKTYRDSPDINVVQVYPFSSERKSMTTIVKVLPKADSKFAGAGAAIEPFYRIYVKGASEIVLKFCSNIALVPGGTIKPNDAPSIVDYTTNVINRYAEQALRTICLAYRDLSIAEFEELVEKDLRVRIEQQLQSENVAHYEEMLKRATEKDDETASTAIVNSDVEAKTEIPAFDVEALDRETLLGHPLALTAISNTNLTCIGVVGIEDPLRPGVPEAVKACQRAGVVVRMVTGDNVLTAKSIASRCGIYSRNGIVMEGPKFRKLSVQEMNLILPNLQVLARSSPTDKQILVGRLKALGETVAVTGDGTNDGPALKMADVGFSMGIAGTEVAKEASSIILLDDNFSSIVKAIMWGRSVNDSVKKFLQFQLTVNITAVIIAFVTAIADNNESSVLTAVQLLWVNLIMDTLAALALATDPPTPSMLNRPPESKKAPLITGNMWRMILGQAVYQIAVGLTLFFAGPSILNFNNLAGAGGMTNVPNELQCGASSSSISAYNEKNTLRTFIFNTFVYMQIFNQINCRTVDGSLNIFKGVLKNYYFCGIFVSINVLQVIITQFGGQVFQTNGLSGGYWAASVVIGAVTLIWGFIMRVIPVGVFYPCIWVVKELKTRVESEPASPAGTTVTAISATGTSIPASQLPPATFGVCSAQDLAYNDSQSMATGITATSATAMCHRNASAVTGYEHLTQEQLQARANWASAISNVRTSLSVFQALRGTRRLESAINTSRNPETSSLVSYRSSAANSMANMP